MAVMYMTEAEKIMGGLLSGVDVLENEFGFTPEQSAQWLDKVLDDLNLDLGETEAGDSND